MIGRLMPILTLSSFKGSLAIYWLYPSQKDLTSFHPNSGCLLYVEGSFWGRSKQLINLILMVWCCIDFAVSVVPRKIVKIIYL